MASVFLSYDHEDAALAKPLVQVLEKAGHTVWFDRHIHGGAQYSRKIEQALDEADAVVVLWSPRSLESAWVRDEAAEGRDRGKLVPLSVEGVTAPMGFRQFQTIALGEWNGRGRVPKSKELLNAVETQAAAALPSEPHPAVNAMPPAIKGRSRPRWLMPVAAIALFAIVAAGAWAWFGRAGLPVVEVAAADPSSGSRAAANDLYVKLGMQAQVGGGKWQLVDSENAPAKPDFIFRTADLDSPRPSRANLVLLDGKSGVLLWSREFVPEAGTDADLRHQLALTAARVLGCALESREAGGLKRDLLRLFLDSCGLLAASSLHQNDGIVASLRKVVAATPDFVPAWSRLLDAQTIAVDMAGNDTGDGSGELARLRKDVDQVAKIAPELPAIALARLYFLPTNDFGAKLNLLDRAIAGAPQNPDLFTGLSFALTRVGRMREAITAAKRAAELDPLSPRGAGQLVMAHAYAGQVDEAREQLREMELLWAGTGALRDVQWAFHLRFGDPGLAKKLARFSAPALDMYLAARADPSPARIAQLRDYMTTTLNRPNPDMAEAGFALQAFGEFKLVDDIYRVMGIIPAGTLGSGSDVLFRPALAGARRDPRFMAVAKRIRLVDHWRKSGKWPDFCSDPQLPYDCKVEAAKYG